MKSNSKIDEKLKDLIERQNWKALSAAFASEHPADIAVVIEHAAHELQPALFALIPKDMKPDVLAELDEQAADVLESLTPAQISDIIGEMAPDDAADILAELPHDESRQILDLMDKEDSDDVRNLLSYPEDTAGGIMTSDVIAVKEHLTIQQVFDSLKDADVDEPFYIINIVDDQRRLVGLIDVWKLLVTRDRSQPIGRIANRAFIAVNVNTDQEEVARLISHYDLTVMPVVDNNGVLVGRVTPDDVIDVLHEEASEDIFRLAGSDDSELEEHSVLKSCKTRLPWLFITLFGGFVTSIIYSTFSHKIADIAVLSFFVPAVMAMGGNTGIQSSTLIVRSIALGTMPRHNLLLFLSKELAIGAVMGIVCGTLIGIYSFVLVTISGTASTSFHPIHLAITVSTALFCAMTFAAMFGSCVPMLMNRFKIDPAVASGPFITIVNDISALAIYFAVTVLLIFLIG